MSTPTPPPDDPAPAADDADDAYRGQDRGDASAYARYLRGMDASMRQKVALTAAHLAATGRVADMGMGSGSGSFALASLYPGLQVVGVDINPEMVERARATWDLPNLSFVLGDIAERCLPERSLDAILDSSVLHHVTTFSGYDNGAVERALANQVALLRDHGVLIVRDFLDPGPGEVWLELPADDFHGARDDPDDPQTCSTATLFERFAREFRRLLPEAQRGFDYRRLDGAPSDPIPPGHRRYALAHTHAVEFVLRKDYRRDWDIEVLEAYTYATQAEMEALFARLGLRVLASTPIRNPWIVANRFRGRFVLRAPGGAALDTPATNYVIVGQKAPAGQGVRLTEAGSAAPVGYLELSHWRRLAGDAAQPGPVYDLVRRPGTTIDVIPHYTTPGGLLRVLARRSFPRPIAGAGDARGLDGAAPARYMSEPLNLQQTDKPLAQTAEELLEQFGGIGPDRIRRVSPGLAYYPSPGGLQEEVRSLLVEIDPLDLDRRTRNPTGFSSTGDLRGMEARQLLRSAQVGGLPEARLELNTYELLLRRGLDPGPWIGASIALEDCPLPRRIYTLAELGRRPPRRRYRKTGAQHSTGFLELRCSRFVEVDAQGRQTGARDLEYVVPSRLSPHTLALAVLRRCGGRVYLGVDDDDLPAAQCFTGHSQLLVAPAWRVPREVPGGLDGARAWALSRLAEEYGVQAAPDALWPLGGPYHPSPGATPEVVYPHALGLARAPEDGPSASRSLRWVALSDLVARRAELHDAHLLILALRAAHALALLPGPPAAG